MDAFAQRGVLVFVCSLSSPIIMGESAVGFYYERSASIAMFCRALCVGNLAGFSGSDDRDFVRTTKGAIVGVFGLCRFCGTGGQFFYGN